MSRCVRARAAVLASNCVGQLSTTTCTTFGFPGAQPGRWSVVVAYGRGNETASPWRTFRFTH